MTTRPSTYTQEQAAVRVGVARRTIRDWQARGWLSPVPGTRESLGYPLYTGMDLVAAERLARAGRTRRRRSLAP